MDQIVDESDDEEKCACPNDYVFVSSVRNEKKIRNEYGQKDCHAAQHCGGFLVPPVGLGLGDDTVATREGGDDGCQNERQNKRHRDWQELKRTGKHTLPRRKKPGQQEFEELF